jgi:hypothetical protein
MANAVLVPAAVPKLPLIPSAALDPVAAAIDPLAASRDANTAFPDRRWVAKTTAIRTPLLDH